MDRSDSQLAAMAGRGDVDAYRRLFERYQHPIYNFVYRMVDNAEDASDIVQDAFIKVHNVLGRQEVQNFSAYLYRTAKNLAYDEMRRRSRFADVDQELLAPEEPNIYADPQRALLLGEQIERVRQAAGGLNEKQRAALILRELEGLDYDEMSEIMESNRNAIGALLSRARLKFREELRMAHVQTEQVPRECEAVIALLSPYIDGELPEAGVSEVEDHVGQCTFCAAALEEMQEASRSFRMFIPVVPPADMAQAFAGRLDELAAGVEPHQGGDSSVDLKQSDRGIPAESAKLSRRAVRLIVWLAAASFLSVSLGFLLLADDIGHDGEAGQLVAGDTADTETEHAADSQRLQGIGPAHRGGIEATGEGQDEAGEVVPDDAGAGEGNPTSDDPAVTDMIVAGYASPNPVDEYSQTTVSVYVAGKPTSVAVKLGGSMTLPLKQQYSSAGEEVWSWTGRAPGYGFYEMTATAVFDSGAVVETGIGTLVVNYYLY